ncbi:mediator of RNA polymerase II [Pseudanabaena phage Pam1]|nr:mediator of RNA polymerase II [Pseudanabaena phage Pam1]
MQNFFDQFDTPAPAPAPTTPGIIRGRTTQPTPIQLEDQTFKREDQARQNRNEIRQEGDTNFNQARNLRKDFDQLPEVSNYKKIISSYAASINTDQTPEGDQLLINSYAQMLNPTSTVMLGEYQATEQNQSTLDQIRASIQRELKFDSAGRLLPESRARVREEMQNIAERANEAYNLRRNEYRGLAERYQFDPAEVIGPHLGDPYRDQIEQYRRQVYGVSDNAEMAGAGTAPAGDRPDDLPPDAKEVVRDSAGNMVGYITEDGDFVTTFRTPERQAYDERVKQAAQGQGGYTERADQGITIGLSDEAAGVGGAISSLFRGANPMEGYQFSRDVKREQNRLADERTGLAGDAVEIGSSLLLPFGAARTAGQAVRVGAVAGGVGGFGYGEGAQNSLTNAAIGTAAGGTLGYGLNRLGNTIANRSQANTQRLVQQNDLMRAAEATGISTPARAFTDPALEARTRAVSQTMIGGQKIREGVQRFGDEIEGAVNNLSTGTPIRNNEAAGAMVREAAERQIKQTGESAKRSYDKAEKLAGNVRLTPTQSLSIIDEMIGKVGGQQKTGLLDQNGNPITRTVEGRGLSETPNLNSEELAFLQRLKSDFSNDLSVAALRRERTRLRQKISKGDLVFGEDEARVLSIMDAAAADIEAGLRAQGKQGAAAAFRAADIKYRARMDYINNTLQKVIGKRNAGLSNEAVMRKFRSLATPGGDSEGLRKFYASLTPEEAADVSATFAEMLGRGGKEGTKDFSTATLVENIEQLKKSGATMTTLFGKDGAKAINDIELLAREHKRIVGATSGGGSAAGNDWRFMLMSMVFPGAGSAAAGGDAVVTGLAAAAGLAIKAGRDALSAKLLMSPRFTNWMRTAPKSNNPTVIDKHWERLGAIAKAEPALAAEIDVFRNAIFSAANDNAQRAVAEDRQR